MAYAGKKESSQAIQRVKYKQRIRKAERGEFEEEKGNRKKTVKVAEKIIKRKRKVFYDCVDLYVLV